jgi:hypothetical protein
VIGGNGHRASSGILTHDLPLTKRVLYQLSYRGCWLLPRRYSDDLRVWVSSHRACWRTRVMLHGVMDQGLRLDCRDDQHCNWIVKPPKTQTTVQDTDNHPTHRQPPKTQTPTQAIDNHPRHKQLTTTQDPDDHPKHKEPPHTNPDGDQREGRTMSGVHAKLLVWQRHA